MRVPHTRCHRGKRVTIILRDGDKLSGRFMERTDRHVILDTGKVRKRDIRAFIICKGGQAGT